VIQSHVVSNTMLGYRSFDPTLYSPSSGKKKIDMGIETMKAIGMGVTSRQVQVI
jgi:hypothetical protein